MTTRDKRAVMADQVKHSYQNQALYVVSGALSAKVCVNVMISITTYSITGKLFGVWILAAMVVMHLWAYYGFQAAAGGRDHWKRELSKMREPRK